jgi:ubiquinone/menaquinone biosynthesis C-methylase UbiE
LTNKITSEDVYTQEVGDLYDEAGISINPVSRELLLDLAEQNGASKDALVLDIGCANGGLSRKLLAKTNCKIEGVELLPFLVDLGEKDNQKLGIGEDKFRITEGSIEDIPFPDNTFDFVFCSDVIGLVEDLDKAISECARVLKPNAKALFYATSFPTETLEEKEAEMIYSTLGSSLGKAITAQQTEESLSKYFVVTDKKVIGGQFGQYEAEHQKDGLPEAASNLYKVSRLLANKDTYVEKYGEKVYRIVLAEAMWSPYILLGKLEPTVFVVQKR